MTPAELNIWARGYSQRKEVEAKESIFQAYLISRWVWQKKINIEKILDAKRKKRIMTDEQMLNQIKTLNAVFGGEIKCKGQN